MTDTTQDDLARSPTKGLWFFPLFFFPCGILFNILSACCYLL